MAELRAERMRRAYLLDDDDITECLILTTDYAEEARRIREKEQVAGSEGQS